MTNDIRISKNKISSCPSVLDQFLCKVPKNWTRTTSYNYHLKLKKKKEQIKNNNSNYNVVSFACKKYQ